MALTHVWSLTQVVFHRLAVQRLVSEGNKISGTVNPPVTHCSVTSLSKVIHMYLFSISVLYLTVFQK